MLTRDATVVLTLMHADVNKASLGNQKGAFQNKLSDLFPSDLWSHLRNQSRDRKLQELLRIKDDAKWLAKLLDSR